MRVWPTFEKLAASMIKDSMQITTLTDKTLDCKEWSDVFGDALPPRLSCLKSTQQKIVDVMMNHIFVISHPDFFPDGPLCPVLRTSFVSLLMYYRNTEKDLGIDSDLCKHIR